MYFKKPGTYSFTSGSTCRKGQNTYFAILSDVEEMTVTNAVL